MSINNLVIDFLQTVDTTPLIFYKCTKEVESFKELTLDELVYECLSLTDCYGSQNPETLSYETQSGKWRSVLDIWRHVRYYQPDVTIFDVMRSLWEQRVKLVGQICNDIHRRVFKLHEHSEWAELVWYENEPEDYDEFELNFNEWADIGL